MAKKKETEDEIRIKLRDHLAKLNGFWSPQYRESNEDLEFSSGKQWDTEVENERQDDDRPCLVLNFTRTLINNVVNPMRLDPMGIKINTSKEEFSDLLSGIYREIEYQSRAQEAYELALENAVTGGFGWVKVSLDYENDEGLDQKIIIEPVRNPLTVFMDPYAKQIDGSDAKYAVQCEWIDEDIAKEEHGDDIIGGISDGIDVYDSWQIPEGSVADLTYYVVKTDKVKRYWYAGAPASTEEFVPDLEIKREREISKKFVMCYRFVGQKLVETSKLPIPFIPLIPFFGDRLYPARDGANILWGGIPHWVKDSQRMVNFYASNEAELAALAPKAPYILEEGQVGQYGEIWGTANKKNHSFLPYKGVSLGDTPVAAPQRADNQAQTGGLIASRAKAQEDMSRESGIFQDQIGDRNSNQDSGIAVLTRKSQGELNTAHYTQNYGQSISQVSRVVLSMIPYAYDTPRNVVIRDEQGQKQTIQTLMADVLTPEIIQQLDVEATAGPAYAAKKKDAIAGILAIAQVDPTAMPLMRDQLVRNMDLPGTAEIADRLEKMLPASLQDGFNAEEALQAQQATAQENEELKAVINKLQTELIDNDKDRETDIVEEVIRAEASLAKTRIQESSADDRQAAKIEAQAQANFNKILEDSRKLEAEQARAVSQI